ncbi:MAG TPA: F0F1 ATP synthase subunit delta [Aeromicrobium sp.]|nr:F0F1 ATP synthase subunit delta [Aeromicrobium sp.]
MSSQVAAGFRGVSATSLAAVLTVVESIEGDLAAVGDELFSVAAALDATPAVRRILTDPSTEADARSGVASSVLGGKVSAETLSVIDAAARGRWTGGRALSHAVEVAGLAAHVAAADRAGSLDTVETELFEAQRLIDGERELRATLSDRTLPADHKATLVDTIFGDKVAAGTLALLRQAAACRTGSFDAVLARFADQVAGRRSRTLAEVRSATALSDAEVERLAAALSAKYGRTVHLNTIVDPAIIGGLKVSIGDDVIDGTIVGRLEDARRQLAG